MCILGIMAGYKKYKQHQAEKNDHAHPVPVRNQPNSAPYPAHLVSPQQNPGPNHLPPHSIDQKHETSVNSSQ
jgi:hypothetical protein